LASKRVGVERGTSERRAVYLGSIDGCLKGKGSKTDIEGDPGVNKGSGQEGGEEGEELHFEGVGEGDLELVRKRAIILP
jgi:hypothetical protein